MWVVERCGRGVGSVDSIYILSQFCVVVLCRYVCLSCVLFVFLSFCCPLCRSFCLSFVRYVCLSLVYGVIVVFRFCLSCDMCVLFVLLVVRSFVLSFFLYCVRSVLRYVVLSVCRSGGICLSCVR